ncbi:MAG: chorismate mutase [Treponema sp.]|jgi:chorismate mutase|nr:chorismate mutase [Treponema sp.]
MKRLYALRGATRCLNETEDMALRVAALYDAMLEQNNLNEGDIVSLVFSVTPDLDLCNPATALRSSGRAVDTALFSLQEAALREGLVRTVRAIIHCYMEEGSVPLHVYQNGAETLRPDRIAPGG